MAYQLAVSQSKLDHSLEIADLFGRSYGDDCSAAKLLLTNNLYLKKYFLPEPLNTENLTPERRKTYELQLAFATALSMIAHEEGIRFKVAKLHYESLELLPLYAKHQKYWLHIARKTEKYFRDTPMMTKFVCFAAMMLVDEAHFKCPFTEFMSLGFDQLRKLTIEVDLKLKFDARVLFSLPHTTNTLEMVYEGLERAYLFDNREECDAFNTLLAKDPSMGETLFRKTLARMDSPGRHSLLIGLLSFTHRYPHPMDMLDDQHLCRLNDLPYNHTIFRHHFHLSELRHVQRYLTVLTSEDGSSQILTPKTLQLIFDDVVVIEHSLVYNSLRKQCRELSSLSSLSLPYNLFEVLCNTIVLPFSRTF